MKKATLLAMLFFALNAQSQKLRFSAGMLISKLDWKTTANDKPFNNTLASLTGGVGVNYLHLGVFNLSTNIEFLKKGGIGDILFTNNLGNASHTERTKIEFNYVALNTFARLKVPTKGKTAPFANIGVYGGYLVSANNIAGSTNEYNKFNIGGLFGIGISHSFLGKEIGIEGNYLPSFNDIYNKASNVYTTKVHDNTFNVKVFFCLSFK